MQGGPHLHNIAGMCVGLGEARGPAFKEYAQQVLDNASCLANHLQRLGFSLVSGGTDKHLMIIDLSSSRMTGKELSTRLAKQGIIVNANTVPGEKRSPLDPSGVRLGTPWVTTRGMKQREMEEIANLISSASLGQDVRGSVAKLCNEFPALIERGYTS